jgi:hypothetical protein
MRRSSNFGTASEIGAVRTALRALGILALAAGDATVPLAPVVSAESSVFLPASPIPQRPRSGCVSKADRADQRQSNDRVPPIDTADSVNFSWRLISS